MNFRSSILAAAPVLLLAVLPGLGACATPEPKSPNEGLTSAVNPPTLPQPPPAPATATIEMTYTIYLTNAMRGVCAGPDPYFSFDSSKPSANDQPTMRNILVCMKEGPLVGKTIKLIGHTDPRGTAAYNEKLGFERANKVKTFLVSNGIATDRVQVASVGAEEASPEPKDWPGDRRVEIDLVK